MKDDRKRRMFRLETDSKQTSDAVDDEVSFHLEETVERLVDAGMSREDAWAEAQRRFGDVEEVKERMKKEGGPRDGRRFTWESIVQDVRYALRQVFRNPMFTTVTVLTLAIGIGSTTAIFSVVDGVLLRPLPFDEPDELVTVWADWSRRGGPVDEWLNFPTIFDLQDRSQTLSAIGAWGGGTMTLTGLGEAEQVIVGAVSHEMLSEVLRVEPTQGRTFALEDDRPGADLTVLLTDGFWQRAFGGDPSVIGTSLTMDDQSYTIIGTLPSGFRSPFITNADVWTPLQQDRASNFCGRGGACIQAVARRGQDATLERTRVELDEIARQLESEYPQSHTNVGLTVIPLRDNMVQDARVALWVLFASVGFVLLIACVNVANLLMARATTRRAELGVRAALGAGRGRISAQLLTESALLAVLGGAFGVAIAYFATDLLVAYAPAGTPRIESVSVDARVLGFASLATILSGVLFGLIPALRGARGDLYAELRSGGRGSSSGGVRGIRARSALVASQVALALILLVGAGLLVRSFQNLRGQDLGFEPEGVLTLQLNLPAARYPDLDARRAFVSSLETDLGTLPGVEAVGATSWLPLQGFGSDTGFEIEGRPPPAIGESQAVWFRRVTPDYPEAMGMRLVSGRWLSRTDDERAPLVVVINSGMAARHFPNETPIGKRLNLGSSEDPTWREIVGVATEARYFGVRDDSRDALYLPYVQAPSPNVTFAIRAQGDAVALAAGVRSMLSSADPSLAAGQLTTMQSIVDDALGSETFVAVLTSSFAFAALLLAMVGLYGVVSYGVSHRLREMGVRLALGAAGNNIEWLVLKQSLALVAIGLAVGVVGGLTVMRLLESLLFGVSPRDPWTFVGVASLLAVVAIAASAIPARRAATVDPIRVLKAE